MTKIYAIGDIHGCLNELKELMAKVDSVIKEEDVLVFLGDYIDRGPDSKGVIDFLISHQESSKVKHMFLRGNHEVMMMDGADYWALNGGYETLESYGFTPTDAGLAYPNMLWNTQFPKNHIDFYKSTVIYYECDSMLFVHAGIDPELNPQESDQNTLIWTRNFVKYQGSYKNNKKIVFGHTPMYELLENPNSYGIDTACVFGGKLTCGVFDSISGTLLDKLEVKSNYSWR